MPINSLVLSVCLNLNFTLLPFVFSVQTILVHELDGVKILEKLSHGQSSISMYRMTGSPNFIIQNITFIYLSLGPNTGHSKVSRWPWNVGNSWNKIKMCSSCISSVWSWQLPDFVPFCLGLVKWTDYGSQASGYRNLLIEYPNSEIQDCPLILFLDIQEIIVFNHERKVI